MAVIPSPGDWRYGVLHALGAPDTAVNLDALSWWAESEGTPASWNNWLATTLGGYGGRDVNSAGVKAYPTLDDGIAATAATLRGGAYFRVVDALKAGNSLTAIWDAVNASPWCYGCQAGHYPVVLYDHLGSKPPPPPPPPHTGGGPSGMPHEQYLAGRAWDDLRTIMSRWSAGQFGQWNAMRTGIRRARR